MDSITAIAAGIQNPLLSAVGLALDSAAIYAILILALMLLGERRDGKRKKIIASLAVAFLLAGILKFAMAHERPCIGETWCPEDNSFPSMHAAIAFTLMIGFLNKRGYPLYLAFALFVSFTRLNLGVHVFLDIAGALPIALISYYLTDIIWQEIEGERNG
ncbi:phosphatase PAP2 family protein [Candidatus Micrarchaeota archaeon]|nr:phosphatase PAP2 family protein [Candidatus Micrarchaeota archaeon]